LRLILQKLPGFAPTAVGMFLFGHLCGIAVLNGYIQSRSGLGLPQFGFVLATGAVAALAVNLYLRRSGTRLSGGLGLLLLAMAVWLPVLAQGLGPLLIAYSLQGAASRIALAGLYRAIAALQRDSEPMGLAFNPTLILESCAGFGLGESFLVNALLTESTGQALWAATLALAVGVPTGLWLRGRLPAWVSTGLKHATPATSIRAPLGLAFTAYCAEVFTITQATAWAGILATSMQLGSVRIAPLPAAGMLSGVFWLVVGTVRFTAGCYSGLQLARVVLLGNLLCVGAVLGVMAQPANALSMLACYALLGAGIACFVPFALQIVSAHARAGELADRMALLGPIMSVAVHLITGNFAPQREWFVLAALGLTLAAAVSTTLRHK